MTNSHQQEQLQTFPSLFSLLSPTLCSIKNFNINPLRALNRQFSKHTVISQSFPFHPSSTLTPAAVTQLEQNEMSWREKRPKRTSEIELLYPSFTSFFLSSFSCCCFHEPLYLSLSFLLFFLFTIAPFVIDSRSFSIHLLGSFRNDHQDEKAQG